MIKVGTHKGCPYKSEIGYTFVLQFNIIALSELT